MESNKRNRVERTRRIPDWLSECMDIEKCGESTTSAEVSIAEDAFQLSSPKKPRTRLQRPSASACRLQDHLNFEDRAPELSRSTTSSKEDLLLQQDLEEASASDVSAASPGPSSMILELPRDVLARVLKCLPINILLQASGVGTVLCPTCSTSVVLRLHIS